MRRGRDDLSNSADNDAAQQGSRRTHDSSKSNRIEVLDDETIARTIDDINQHPLEEEDPAVALARFQNLMRAADSQYLRTLNTPEFNSYNVHETQTQEQYQQQPQPPERQQEQRTLTTTSTTTNAVNGANSGIVLQAYSQSQNVFLSQDDELDDDDADSDDEQQQQQRLQEQKNTEGDSAFQVVAVSNSNDKNTKNDDDDDGGRVKASMKEHWHQTRNIYRTPFDDDDDDNGDNDHDDDRLVAADDAEWTERARQQETQMDEMAHSLWEQEERVMKREKFLLALSSQLNGIDNDVDQDQDEEDDDGAPRDDDGGVGETAEGAVTVDDVGGDDDDDDGFDWEEAVDEDELEVKQDQIQQQLDAAAAAAAAQQEQQHQQKDDSSSQDSDDFFRLSNCVPAKDKAALSNLIKSTSGRARNPKTAAERMADKRRKEAEQEAKKAENMARLRGAPANNNNGDDDPFAMPQKKKATTFSLPSLPTTSQQSNPSFDLAKRVSSWATSRNGAADSNLIMSSLSGGNGVGGGPLRTLSSLPNHHAGNDNNNNNDGFDAFDTLAFDLGSKIKRQNNAPRKHSAAAATSFDHGGSGGGGGARILTMRDFKRMRGTVSWRTGEQFSHMASAPVFRLFVSTSSSSLYSGGGSCSSVVGEQDEEEEGEKEESPGKQLTAAFTRFRELLQQDGSPAVFAQRMLDELNIGAVTRRLEEQKAKIRDAQRAFLPAVERLCFAPASEAEGFCGCVFSACEGATCATVTGFIGRSFQLGVLSMAAPPDPTVSALKLMPILQNQQQQQGKGQDQQQTYQLDLRGLDNAKKSMLDRILCGAGAPSAGQQQQQHQQQQGNARNGGDMVNQRLSGVVIASCPPQYTDLVLNKKRREAQLAGGRALQINPTHCDFVDPRLNHQHQHRDSLPQNQDIFLRVIYSPLLQRLPQLTDDQRSVHLLHQFAFRLIQFQNPSHRSDAALPFREKLIGNQTRRLQVDWGYRSLFPHIGANRNQYQSHALWARRLLIETVVRLTAPELLCDAADLSFSQIYDAFPTVESIGKRVRDFHKMTTSDVMGEFGGGREGEAGTTRGFGQRAEFDGMSVSETPRGMQNVVLRIHQRRTIEWMLARERLIDRNDDDDAGNSNSSNNNNNDTTTKMELKPFPPLHRPPLTTDGARIPYRFFCNMAFGAIVAAPCGSDVERFMLNLAVAANEHQAAGQNAGKPSRPLPRSGGILASGLGTGKTCCLLATMVLNQRRVPASIIHYDGPDAKHMGRGALNDGIGGSGPFLIGLPLHREQQQQPPQQQQQPPAMLDAAERFFLDNLQAKFHVGTTLYVAPVTLLPQIEQEIRKRCGSQVTILKWHGTNRHKFTYEMIANATIILTTEKTVALDLIASELMASELATKWAANRGRAALFCAARCVVFGAAERKKKQRMGGDDVDDDDDNNGAPAAAAAASSDPIAKRARELFDRCRKKLIDDPGVSRANKLSISSPTFLDDIIASMELAQRSALNCGRVWLNRIRFRRVILDEYHRCSSLPGLDSDITWLVSGTPLDAAVSFYNAPLFGVLSSYTPAFCDARKLGAAISEIELQRTPTIFDHVSQAIWDGSEHFISAVCPGSTASAPHEPEASQICLTWARAAVLGRCCYRESVAAVADLVAIKVTEHIVCVKMSRREQRHYQRSVDAARANLTPMLQNPQLFVTKEAMRILLVVRKAATDPFQYRVELTAAQKRRQAKAAQQGMLANVWNLLAGAVAADGAAQGGGGEEEEDDDDNTRAVADLRSVKKVPVHVFAYLVFQNDPREFERPRTEFEEPLYTFLRQYKGNEAARSDLRELLREGASASVPVCPVCLEQTATNGIVFLRCMHSFCAKCLLPSIQLAQQQQQQQQQHINGGARAAAAAAAALAANNMMFNCPSCRENIVDSEPKVLLDFSRAQEEEELRLAELVVVKKEGEAKEEFVADAFVDAVASQQQQQHQQQQQWKRKRKFDDGLSEDDGAGGGNGSDRDDDDDNDDGAASGSDTDQEAGDNDNSNNRPPKSREPSKFKEVVKIIRAARRNDPTAKTLIFSSWPSVVKQLQQFLVAKRVGCVAIEGSTPLQSRATKLRQFQDSGNQDVVACIISAETGACGVNFQCASVLVMLDPQTSKARDEQAMGRLKRLGQRAAEIFVHRLLSEETVDARLFEHVKRFKKLTLATGSGVTNSKKKKSEEAQTEASIAKVRHLVFGEGDALVPAAAAYVAGNNNNAAASQNADDENTQTMI